MVVPKRIKVNRKVEITKRDTHKPTFAKLPQSVVRINQLLASRKRPTEIEKILHAERYIVELFKGGIAVSEKPGQLMQDMDAGHSIKVYWKKRK